MRKVLKITSMLIVVLLCLFNIKVNAEEVTYEGLDDFAEKIVYDFNNTGNAGATAITTRENFKATTHPNIKYVWNNEAKLAEYKWFLEFALAEIKDAAKANNYTDNSYYTSTVEMLEKMIAGDTTAIGGSYADGRMAFRWWIEGLINAKLPAAGYYANLMVDYSKAENMARFEAVLPSEPKTKYTITWDLAGGEWSENAPATQLAEGTVLPTPVKADYVFAGWYLGNEKVVSVHASGTYVAKWLVLDCGNHKLVDHVGKEAKCEEIGWQAYQTCEKCCYTTYEEIPATGHAMGEWYVVEPAKCEETGVDQKDCANCDYFETKDSPRTGHNYEGDSCLNCGEKVSAGLKYEILNSITVEGQSIVLTNVYENHEALVADFMKDLNTYCGTNVADPKIGETLTANHDFYKSFNWKIATTTNAGFVTDDAMWAKWSWLFNYISLKSAAVNGPTISSDRKLVGSETVLRCTVWGFLTKSSTFRVSWARMNVDWTAATELENVAKTAVLSGMGTCTDKDVIIQKEYKGVVVSTILPSVFAGNTDITSVTIASGITSINTNEFLGCTSLEAINVDVKNETYKSVDGVLYSADGKTLLVYPAAKEAENFVTPEGVEVISNNAFNGCKNLKSITLSEGVKSIGNFVFSGCENLETLSLPSTLTTFSQNALNGCPKINEVYYAKTLNDFIFVGYTSSSNPISVANKFYLLDENNEYYHLTEVVIPKCDFSRYLQEYTFYGYEGLTKVTFEEGSNWKQIGARAFAYCTNLKVVELPNTITAIGYDAFRGCTSLETITLPESLNSFSSWFAECENLKSVYIPLSLSNARIYGTVFGMCPNLTIYCEAEAKPDTWADNWNGTCPVVWGYCIHKLEEHAGKVEDCENIGWDAYVTCSKCDYTTYKEIPATGHTYDEWTVVEPAKCEAEGLERRDCVDCDHFETQPIAATGHAMGEWYVVEPAKCEAEGLEQKDCANCDHFETQPIAATGHAMGEWYVVKEASTQVEGLKQKDCANCDHFETEAIRKVTFADLIERGMTAIGNIFDSIGNIFGSTSNMASSVSDALNLDQVAKSFASFIQSIFAMDDEEEQKESLYEYIFG